MGDDWHRTAHVVISTYATWLPGDPRGFRDHNHRIHSSGDYKSPPPIEEHSALRRFVERLTGTEVVIPGPLRPVVAEALATKLRSSGFQVRIMAVGTTHAHILMPAGEEDVKPVIGRAKQAASHRVRVELPGTVWAQGCDVTRIRDEDHYREVVRYIHDHRLEGAFILTSQSFRAGQTLPGLESLANRPAGQSTLTFGGPQVRRQYQKAY